MDVLLDPMRTEGYPEMIEEVLPSRDSSGASHRARCVAFNRRGTLLAAGTDRGDVVIWDCLTKGVAAVLGGGVVDPITSVSWAKDGRRCVGRVRRGRGREGGSGRRAQGREMGGVHPPSASRLRLGCPSSARALCPRHPHPLPLRPDRESVGRCARSSTSTSPSLSALPRLLTSSTSGRLVEWDVASGKPLFTAELGLQKETQRPLHCMNARLHPYTPHLALACPIGQGPLLLDLATGAKTALPYAW